MINWFLRAKHWQLFLLMFGLPIMFEFIMMGSIISDFGSNKVPYPSDISRFMTFFPLIMIVCLGTVFGWFWSVAIGLQQKVPANVTMKVKKFKVFFFIPLIYILFFMVFFIVFVNSFFTADAEQNFVAFGAAFAVIFPIHLFTMFCILYCMYFVAKTFKTVELQKEVRFSDFAGEFLLIWFYIIGIWIIQPKINKMIAEQTLQQQ